MFDIKKIEQRFGRDTELLGLAVDIFLKDYPKRLEKIKQSIDVHDAIALRQTAHALRGAVSNFSAQELVKIAHQLETMAEKGQFDEATVAVYLQLEQGFERFGVALKAARP